MKKLLTLTIFLILLAIPVFSQDDQIDDLNFEPTELDESSVPYFAIAGGYTGTFFFPKFDDLNAHFKILNIGEFEAPMYLNGVQGFTAIGIIPNVRIGFFGMTGSKTQKANIDINGTNVERGLDYYVSLTGINLDYGFVPFKSLAILPGINVGWGGLTLEAYQGVKDYDWGSFNTQVDSLNFMNRAKSTFSFIQPNLSIEWTLTSYFMIRGNVGYNYSFALTGDWEWEMNKYSNLKNVPNGINANGLTAQFGIFLGLFNY